MPTVAVTKTESIKGLTATWTGLAAGDDGAPVDTQGNKTTVQVSGTFGTSTVTLQGSNDGAVWTNLNDESVPGNACSFTANGLKGVLQAPKFIKPVVSAGTGTALTVLVFNR